MSPPAPKRAADDDGASASPSAFDAPTVASAEGTGDGDPRAPDFRLSPTVSGDGSDAHKPEGSRRPPAAPRFGEYEPSNVLLTGDGGAITGEGQGPPHVVEIFNQSAKALPI
ncbi:MAG TPA: hypothetical protein VML55_12310 [Planctomycetaceae bacterium]|nr:hypothetical protein [Planctomycetaceae bacterium]